MKKVFSKLEIEVLTRMINDNKCPWDVRCDICDHFKGEEHDLDDGICAILGLKPSIVMMLQDRDDLNKQARSIVKNKIL